MSMNLYESFVYMPKDGMFCKAMFLVYSITQNKNLILEDTV